MCGRFVLTEPSDRWAALFGAVPDNDLPDLPNYNICPTNRIHAVTLEGGRRRLRSLRWGFVPHWAKSEADGPLLINARAETIAEKPAFRAAARERRCLIPANGFYEWSKDADGNRLPWYVRPRGGAEMVFAGVWQEWTRGEAPMTTVAIVTTAASGAIARVHHRMPVIVDRKDWPLWLGEAGKGAARLMTAPPNDILEVYRVDPAVNSNRASGPDLIEPIMD
ncbi:MAG: SOS response-associated peptidase [Paracoccaceae bacterium]|nr:SOS response-associated peptidase [Paracoccaceae bacterium]